VLDPPGAAQAGAHHRRIRTAFLLPAFDVGGAERAVARTAARLDRERYDVVVAAFTEGTGRLFAVSELAGVRTRVIGSRRGLRLVPQLWSWIRLERPHVLLTYMFHANQAGRLCGRAAGVPVVVGSERVVGWEPSWRIGINRLTARWTDGITTNSRAGQQFWATHLRLPIERLDVIYNGVDTGEFRPSDRLPSRRVRLGVLARLHRANGHDWLLDGLATLRSHHPRGWTCVLAGDGPEQTALRQKVARLGLGSLVDFRGHIEDAPTFLRSLDVYVHPSLVSGMPNAVLEAMACGLPVLATAVGGTPEAVADGETGWLVDVGDSHLFAQRAASLIGDPGLRQRMGARGRERAVDSFSIDAMVGRTEALLERLLRSKLGLHFRTPEGWVPVTGGGQRQPQSPSR
jgi:glycosyltransferase involved in cell wall biosynthesis